MEPNFKTVVGLATLKPLLLKKICFINIHIYDDAS